MSTTSNFDKHKTMQTAIKEVEAGLANFKDLTFEEQVQSDFYLQQLFYKAYAQVRSLGDFGIKLPQEEEVNHG